MGPYAMLVMLTSLAIGTLMTLSSYHWLLAWAGLEISTLAIIPMMTQHPHPRTTEAATKYFLTQATASALILFSSLTNAWSTGQWEIKEMTPPASNMLTIALAMKLGLAPMHFWLPEVIQGLDLTTGLILSTWQKIAPMALLYLTSASLNTTLLTILALASTLLGGWGGLNQTQLRKILAYSSIAHLGWMVIIMPFSPILAMLNFTIYVTLTSTLFLTMKATNTTKINTLTMTWTKTPVLATLSALTLLSLGGLPPMTGFVPKWLILQELTKQNLAPTAMMIAFSALLGLFFYLRLTYTMSLTYSPNNPTTTISWRYKTNQTTFLLALMMILSMMLLPLTATMKL
ncbi:NADH dehydrogenase subunit 2 (mitochondrion) [Rhinatrema bivittatum]|uniref:NADH-ubiquinone oxidoreductase chain 2 n=1 Tax=Rhinatrema bivittatum TaxID=194408 RepID=Q64JS0_RHIBI|nr:NADH dehydrogenase subunit 2 [Rhinatrema bivittatum]AAS13719.1 NADH dehydrogenase subunit 2 [Rhinatrema bivittatum]